MIQRLGDIFTQLRQACTATARAGGRSGNDHPLARQVFGEGLARRSLTDEGRNLGGPGGRSLCLQLILCRRGFELLELQLELVEQPGTALGALAEPLAPKLLDLQLEMDDQRLIVG